MNRGAGGHDGIVEQDVEATLKNLGDLGTLGMRGTNRVILEMLLKKQNERLMLRQRLKQKLRQRSKQKLRQLK